MVDADVADTLEYAVLDGLCWRWADGAEPAPTDDGWSLPTEDGRIARWSGRSGELRVGVEEWVYEHFCAHFDGIPALDGRHDLTALIELIGRAVSHAELTRSGILTLRLENGPELIGPVNHVHCDDHPEAWEISREEAGMELWKSR